MQGSSSSRDDDEPELVRPSTSERFRPPAQSTDKDFGKWQRHTKGIGAKLLEKMGWDPSKGLGKNQQGIVAPIEARTRPGGVGLGAIKEFKQQAKLVSVPEKPSTSTSGPKEPVIAKPKVKKEYVYRSVDELLDEALGGDNGSSEIANTTKVLDMRGPNTKILSNYSEISQAQTFSLDSEIETALRSTEQSLVRNGKSLRKVKEKLDSLNEDRKEINDSMLETNEKFEKLNNLLTIIKKIEVSVESDQLTASQILKYFHLVTENFPQESVDLRLNLLFYRLLKRAITLHLTEWKTISQHEMYFTEFSKMGSVMKSIDSTLYEKILWDCWMQRLNKLILSLEDFKHPDELISLLDCWSSLLPLWLLYHIYSQIIIPKLDSEVENWDPLTDVIPIHTWIHPWLPLLVDHNIENIFSSIRRKIGLALTAWHASDVSAKIILEPWHNVFKPESWNVFLSTHIVPKLANVLNEMEINPSSQNLDPWHWVLAWQDLMSPNMLASLLAQYFFPKWLNVLYQWLCQRPNFDEISTWYSGWRSLIPESLSLTAEIQSYLRKGLEMMDFAVSSPLGMNAYSFNAQPTLPIVSNPEQLAFLRHNLMSQSTASSTNDSINFKQLVARRASERGVLFMPLAKKDADGHLIHQLGNHQVYIDRSVIFAFNPSISKWIPVSIDDLLNS